MADVKVEVDGGDEGLGTELGRNVEGAEGPGVLEGCGVFEEDGCIWSWGTRGRGVGGGVSKRKRRVFLESALRSVGAGTEGEDGVGVGAGAGVGCREGGLGQISEELRGCVEGGRT